MPLRCNVPPAAKLKTRCVRRCQLQRFQTNPRAAQVLILLSALSTCDPGNILDSLKLAKQHRVRVSVVGLAAQVHICETLTQVRR